MYICCNQILTVVPCSVFQVQSQLLRANHHGGRGGTGDPAGYRMHCGLRRWAAQSIFATQTDISQSGTDISQSKTGISQVGATAVFSCPADNRDPHQQPVPYGLGGGGGAANRALSELPTCFTRGRRNPSLSPPQGVSVACGAALDEVGVHTTRSRSAVCFMQSCNHAT